MSARSLDLDRLIARMQGVPAALSALLAQVTDEESRFNPPSGAWSILEIVCHLCDEETLDFRARIASTLASPEAPWPATDPEGWPAQHNYAQFQLSERLRTFSRLRHDTVHWLASLKAANWHSTHLHPRHGPLIAGELMVSWAAHDALHIRQIAKRLFQLAARDGALFGYTTRYAGEWGA